MIVMTLPLVILFKLLLITKYLGVTASAVFQFLIQLVEVILLADFISGFVHWLEDRLGEPDTPIIGKWIVQPNILHHYNPTAFVSKNWWQSSWDLALAVLIIWGVAIITGHFGWQVILFGVLSANANQFHKWTHMPLKKVPTPIRWLMHAHIIQDARHHMQHHTAGKDTAYCVITPWLNPILDKLHFWRLIEMPIKPWMSVRD